MYFRRRRKRLARPNPNNNDLSDRVHRVKVLRIGSFSLAGIILASARQVLADVFITSSFNQPVSTSLEVLTSPVSTNVPGWITQPLSMVDALNLTLKQNSGLQKARADLEASRGLVIKTRAMALPTMIGLGNAQREVIQSLIQKFTQQRSRIPQPAPTSWNTGVQIVQNIYQGGRMLSAFRAARLAEGAV